jgi:hypothetical protein
VRQLIKIHNEIKKRKDFLQDEGVQLRMRQTTNEKYELGKRFLMKACCCLVGKVGSLDFTKQVQAK